MLLAASGAPGWHTLNSNIISRSAMFNGSDTGMTKSNSSHSSTEVVMACWFHFTSRTPTNQGILGFGAGGSGSTESGLWLSSNSGFGGTTDLYLYANGQGSIATHHINDYNSWYHILASYKLDEADSLEKAKLFLNGKLINSFSDERRGNFSTSFSNTANYQIGQIFGANPFAGYIAQPIFLDGKSIQAGDVSITDFVDTYTFTDGNGDNTNATQIIPKQQSDITALAQAAGGNSAALDMNPADPTASNALGLDLTTHDNDFTTTNMDENNQSTHTPSLVCTVFSEQDYVSNDGTLTNGGTTFATGGNDSLMALTQTVIETGCYWEAKVTTAGDEMFGLWANSTTPLRSASTSSPHQDAAAFVVRIAGNGLFVAGSDQGFTSAGISANDVLMFAYKDGQFFYGKNGNWENSADPQAETGELFTITNSSTREIQIVFGRAGSANVTYEIKMKADEWAHTATKPSWGAAINSANQPSVSHQGKDYFQSTEYEGNGQNQRVGDFVPYTDLYTVSKSAIFDEASRHYLARTFSASDAARTSTTDATISFWIKFCPNAADQEILSSSDAGESTRFRLFINDQASEEAITLLLDPSGGGNNRIFTISHGLLSEQEWVNFVFNIDVDNSTAANKVRAYVNGVEKSSSDTTYQNAGDGELHLFDNQLHNIGNFAINNTKELNSYLAELHVNDGSLKGPESFGQVDTSTNRWTAKDYKTDDGTYGGRGFYMAFESTFASGNGAGTDSSGNGFHFTESTHNDAWATTDQSNDTPSNNLPIWLGKDQMGSAAPPLSEGNLKVTGADNGGRVLSFPFTRGKWYWEIDVIDAGQYVGFATPAGIAFASATPWNNNAGSFLAAPDAGHFLGTNGSGTANLVSNYTAYIGNGDRMAIAFDADNKFAYIGEVGSGGSGSTLAFVGRGGVAGDPTSGQAGTGAAPFGLDEVDNRVLYHVMASGGSDMINQWIFDPTGFNGTPPTGYSALSQDNLDAGSSKITSWAWIKNRDATDSHMLFDRVRGVGNDLHSDANSAQVSSDNTMQRFLQRGVQVGPDVQVNTVNESYVLWQWLIGTSASTGSTFTGGSPDITSTGIVATPGHFSVGVYEGSGTDDDDISHGLGGTIEMLWVKHFAADTDDWMIWHKGLTSNSHQLHLNTTDDEDTTLNAWGSNPVFDANVFRVGVADDTNKDSTGNSHVFYAFRSIPGVCKVGSYEGNGSADGPVIVTGFKPTWTLIKNIDTSGDSWIIHDTVRGTANPVHILLKPDSNAVEADSTGFAIDFLTNGFKVRGTDHSTNESGQTFVYLAMSDIAGNGDNPPVYTYTPAHK